MKRSRTRIPGSFASIHLLSKALPGNITEPDHPKSWFCPGTRDHGCDVCFFSRMVMCHFCPQVDKTYYEYRKNRYD
jgi:hypothetical protein